MFIMYILSYYVYEVSIEFFRGSIPDMSPKKGVDLPKLLTLRLDQAMRERLEQMAMEEERTLGGMARIILREGLEARERKKGKGKR
jgi:hypothetical protein